MSEKENKHCMLMENVCYRRDDGCAKYGKRVFGELLHCQGGYQHDLRDVKFNDGKQPYGGGLEFNDKGYSESKWRTQHSINRNGIIPYSWNRSNLYNVKILLGETGLSMAFTASQSRGLTAHY